MGFRKAAAWWAICILFASAGVSCSGRSSLPNPRDRRDTNGWVTVHLKGQPWDIGYQHGWQLAPEIDDVLNSLSFYLEGLTKRPWAFFREAASRMFWPKLEPQYQTEIEGIAAGLHDRLAAATWDKIDITALNGWIELAWYYVPYLDAKARPGSAASQAPPYCSAFIATGSYTKDRRIVMGHNNWCDYIIGERWNAVLDIQPASGHRIIMDAIPGFIHSGDDFVINDSGLLYTETTISGFMGFRESGTPEFVRARKAAQYASSIDDFIRIMSKDNNGAYANDWLVGDLKTNEIARFELGLNNQRVWRTSDGYYVGSNFPLDPKFIAEETNFKADDLSLSVHVRRARWEKLMETNKGHIDAELGKTFEADHIDNTTGAPAANGNVLCGHVDNDPKGMPEGGSWGPFFPAGSVQGKVTTAALATAMTFWGHMGHPCGEDFVARDYFSKHPEYAWEGRFLRDMKAYPWTLFKAKR